VAGGEGERLTQGPPHLCEDRRLPRKHANGMVRAIVAHLARLADCHGCVGAELGRLCEAVSAVAEIDVLLAEWSCSASAAQRAAATAE
jgi:hypothetical protein